MPYDKYSIKFWEEADFWTDGQKKELKKELHQIGQYLGFEVHRMEVDLLCAEAHLAIELDGAQHLGNVDAYRRDRRKDALLQEKGYTILRFLCYDVGKRLDEVLDSILRALVHLHKEPERY